AVAGWLEAANSSLTPYRPRVTLQGSFRLGTVVRPVIKGRGADYDIDQVCCLDRPGAGMQPGTLKHRVGDRLREHGTYRGMLDEEGRRCWTLNYAEDDGVGFHLDVLPAIPAGQLEMEALARRGISPEILKHAIEVSERRARGIYVWLPGGSNPEG